MTRKELSKNCPVCGKEGFICAVTAIAWSKNRPRTIMLGESNILLGDSWSGTMAEARRCLECKIVIFSYEKEPL
jgi:alpha-D-ribose 1-methylphosphonate 5-triphosphate diphosphatase PhnM